jgi:signal transduction histidine kinase
MCVVGEAGDGLAGIDAVRMSKPDVVLLDLSMPVMDGLEALPQIRALAPTARIVVLSGFSASELTERALEAGADGYLQKGLSLGAIVDYIRNLDADQATGRAHLAAADDAWDVGAGTVDTVDDVPDQYDPPLDRVRGADVLARSPCGVMELSAEPPYRLIWLNVAARGLLVQHGAITPGTPLPQVCSQLSSAIAENRLRGDIDCEASDGTQTMRMSLRPAGKSLLVYLHPVSDELGKLRSAIATTAHELRGPVGVLRGIAEMLTTSGASDLDPSVQARFMESVQRQALTLDTITADLLTAAQIQRGTLRVEMCPLDPVARIETLIQDRYPGSVTIDVADDRQVLADPLRFEQMIGNLLSNAQKYGRPPVVLRTRPCSDRPELICIDIADHGPGVPTEFQSQLFNEYSRASGTAASGTGLGLHVVRTLAQAQGGAVCYSTAPGGGAVFTLTLQAVSAA